MSNKTKKTRTSIYISESMKAEAEKMAEAENRTLSNFIETMIKERASKDLSRVANEK